MSRFKPSKRRAGVSQARHVPTAQRPSFTAKTEVKAYRLRDGAGVGEMQPLAAQP